jgi:Putative abortive phage resistance protein AbiGi, antitoxin
LGKERSPVLITIRWKRAALLKGEKMKHAQRYVSNELCHFVGKGKTPEEQYDLLVNKILKAGALTHGPNHDLAAPRGLGLDLSKPISTDEMLKYEVVCFCDIPQGDLHLHVRKYSSFGLSLQKEFLIDRGACPVFYVANESPVPEFELFNQQDFADRLKAAQQKGMVDRALFFDTSVKAIIDILLGFDVICSDEPDRYFKRLDSSVFKERIKLLFGLTEPKLLAFEASIKGNAQAAKTIRNCTNFLVNYIFSYVKAFDAKRPFEDERNFYMEREWRVANNVTFAIDDVSRVFFPKKYAARFRQDLPEYVGQVTFLD